MKLLRYINQSKVVLDANVILRYLLSDNEQLAENAATMIASKKCSTSLEVIAEVVFVLQSKRLYNIPRDEIALGLTALTYEIQIERKRVLRYALQAYCEKPKLDFIDCILYGYSRLGYTIFTFDKKLNRKIYDRS